MSAPIRLLHVDDDADMAELTALYLQRENDAFEIETETDPTAALDRLDSDLDVIVCDYDMPEMTGLEFLEEVRRSYPDLPFVLFTGQGSEEIASEAISAGVTDYLQKGYGSDVYAVLANRVTNAVEQHRSKRALAESRKRLSMFIEHSPLGVIEWDEEFRVRRLNDAAEEILGYDGGELQGVSWRQFVPESAEQAVEEVVSDLLNVRGGYHSINETVRADGTRITCEWHNRVITDDDGEVVTIFSQFQDVTERRANRERLERLVDNIPGVIYRTGTAPEWPFELVRGACEELTGYTEDELLTDVAIARKLVHVDDRELVETEIANGVAENGTYDVVYRLSREDEDIRWVWERGQVVDDGDERIEEGLVIDVDSLKRSESALDRTNRVLTTLLENLPFGVLVEDDSRKVLVTNERFTELLDVDANPDELVGADCAQAAAELADRFAEPEAFVNGIAERLADREPVQNEEIVLNDGRILERDYVPYRLADGEANLWIYRDVSDEREQQLLLNGLFEESLDGIGVKGIVTDEDGEPIDYTYERVNERFEELTGLNAEDVVGRRATEAIPGIEETPFIDIFGEVGLGGEPRTFEQYSAPLDRYYKISAFSPRHGQCITIFSNITERKRYERRLERQNDRLENFTGVVSHDLRNPLNVARGRLELGRETSDNEHFEAVSRSLERMDDLIDDLLLLSRQGEVIGEPEWVSLSSVASASWDGVKTDGATLEIDADLELRADKGRLRQAIENLIRNSVEHGMNGRPRDDRNDERIHIRIGTLPDGFFIEDDGVGIPEAERDRVFEHGMTASTDGTGFGLSIVGRIVDAHGWTIDLLDGDDGGVRFEVTGVETRR
ncbi:PAS domain S-box protein [Halorubrum vacuolatum]|uniref:histidine kinase n=1 Tax=Halorubrum vacuolatum TaxID=63740 RepID=A0A238VEH0_HALVU|nr:PAS domain S-box protein [Halorubrum vacuolatum]SNR32800.1 PAS domain S-box-containing protein [Halorubrum vacuolatum]